MGFLNFIFNFFGKHTDVILCSCNHFIYAGVFVFVLTLFLWLPSNHPHQLLYMFRERT